MFTWPRHQMLEYSTDILIHIYSKSPRTSSNRLHIATVTLYGKYWPWTKKHNRPVGPENTSYISHDSFWRKRTGIPPSTCHKFMRSLTTDDQKNLPNDNCRCTQTWQGTYVDETDKEKRQSWLPPKDPSNNGNWKYKADIAAITVKHRNVQIRNMYGICGANCAIDTESNEVSLIVAADARCSKKAVMVTDSNTVPTQWAVVRTRWHVYPTVSTVPPVTAWQCVISNMLTYTVAPPDEQKVPKNLQHTQ